LTKKETIAEGQGGVFFPAAAGKGRGKLAEKVGKRRGERAETGQNNY